MYIYLFENTSFDFEHKLSLKSCFKALEIQKQKNPK